MRAAVLVIPTSRGLSSAAICRSTSSIQAAKSRAAAERARTADRPATKAIAVQYAGAGNGRQPSRRLVLARMWSIEIRIGAFSPT